MGENRLWRVIESKKCGPLRIGEQRQQVEDHLGSPLSAGEVNQHLVTYGNLEVVYDRDGKVEQYKLCFERTGNVPLSNWIEPEAWDVSTVLELLAVSGFRWCFDASYSTSDVKFYAVENGVTMAFRKGRLSELLVGGDGYFQQLKGQD